MMKSKNPKIQKILMKGIAISLTAMFIFTPLAYAATSLDDSYLESSIIDKVLYGTVGSMVKEMEEYFGEGQGKKLYIKNEAGLRALAEYVNNGNSCEGQRIYLADNIEINSNEEWVPIGKESSPFKGTFDGQGHTIKGIVFTRGDKKDSDLNSIGLFGKVLNGTIKNITLADSKLEISYDLAKDITQISTDVDVADDSESITTAFYGLGGIVGFNVGGTIENCTIEDNVKISGLNRIGGIVGFNRAGIIEGCTNNGTITGFTSTGGIVGNHSGDYIEQTATDLNFAAEGVGKVLNCTNNGIVYNQIGGAGGIVGLQYFSSITQGCVNNGKVSIATEKISIYILGKKYDNEPQNAGGIVGWITGDNNSGKLYYTAIDGCINKGSVIGYRDIGGIAGQLGGAGGGNTIMRNCINYTTDIEATYPISSRSETGEYRAEEGFLAGEISPDQTYRGKTYLYNNMYYMTEEFINKAAKSEISAGENLSTLSKKAIYCDYYVGGPTDSPITLGRDNKSGYEHEPAAPGGTETNTYYTLAYGYSVNDVEYRKTTTIIVDIDGKKTMVLPTTLGGSTYSEVAMKNYDLSTSYLDYHPILTKGTSSETSSLSYNDQVKVKINKNSVLYEYNANTDLIEIKNDSKNIETIITSGSASGVLKTGVKYTVRKKVEGTEEYQDVTGMNAVFKSGDTIKVTVELDKYLVISVLPKQEMTKEDAPKLYLGNAGNSYYIGVGPHGTFNIPVSNITTTNNTTTIDYERKITSDDPDFTYDHMGIKLSKALYDYSSTLEIGNITTYKAIVSNTVTIDTTAPIVNTKVYVENKLETGRYTAGKEILIETRTNEAIQDNYTTPTIQVSFSESGIGKYNYTKEPETVGYAKCKDAKINIDGSVTWSYSYIIQEGDEGDLSIEYKDGEITDLAGNTTNIKELYTPQPSTGTTVTGNAWNDELGVTYEFYKNSVSDANKVTSNTYFTEDDDLIVVATYDKVLYVHYGLSDGKNTNVRLTNSYTDRAPNLYLNGNTSLKNTSINSITNHEDSTKIEYQFDISSYSLNELTNIDSVTLKNENNTATVTTNGTTVTTNGLIPFADEWYSTYQSEDESKYKTISSNAIKTTTGIENIVLDPIGVSSNIEQDDIYADTTSPTVDITIETYEGGTLQTNPSVTKESRIRIKFEWSEKVEGFTEDDIKITNVKNTDSFEGSEKTYYIYANTTIPDGEVGEMEVVIEQDACKDLVGLSNVRNAKTIKIDRQAPVLLSLEAHADSAISLGDNINEVKDQYKIGDTITVVATFNENIAATEELPKLALQFSESGNAKGTIAGKAEGNKITYTYTITTGDTGELSVKGFSGEVQDVAGNITKVAKKALDGNTIIADSEAPKIAQITAIAPDFSYDQFVKNNEEDTQYLEGETKRYGIGKQIKFLVEFNEELYHLDTNNKVQTIVSETAPTLKIKFGTGTTREAVFSKVDGKVLEYTYDIQSEDNGNLSLVSMTGAISDIAGNSITNHSLVTLAKYEDSITEENKVDVITADTTSSAVKLKVTQIENDGLTGTQNHYKAGNILTITATTNEYVYSKYDNNLSKITSETTPSLGIKFGEEEAKGNLKCIKVDYVYDESTNTMETVFTYEYVMATGDNGEISLSFGNNQYYDIALNGNSNGTTNSTSQTVIADTISPNTSHLEGTYDNSYIKDNGDGTYTVKFTEKLYYLNNNAVIALTNSNVAENGPKLTLKNESGEFIEIAPSSISSDGTEITYTAESGLERIGLSSYNKICDVAGNMYNSQVKTGPTLANIRITSPENKTGKYATGTEVTIVATFTKKIQGTVPTLTIRFGEEGTQRSISSGTIDRDTITYQYIIQEGDNGELRIVSLEGNALTDEEGTTYEAPATISITGGTITADTTKPTVQIKAYTDYKTSSKKEVSGKTNTEEITYEFTWSEEVTGFEADDINVINGIKDTFTKVSNMVYTLDVVTSNDGIQTVTVPSGVCTDTAKIGRYDEETEEYVVEDIGNQNASARMNSIEIDRTAPTVRFITPNGGNYTTTTDSRTEESTGTATLKARLTINEDVSEIKYRIVKQGEETPEYTTVSGDQINSSDIDITIKDVTVGEYTVEVIAIDEAGNQKQAISNKYVVTANTITLTPDTTAVTNKDITVTVSYGEALTENRKAGIQGKTLSADSTKVIVSENGTVYAEATDIAGNKVYATLEITNINKNEPTDPDTPEEEEDTTPPEITFNYTTTTATVGTTIGATITTNEDAIISYSWDNENWASSSDYTRSVNVKRTPTKAGTYTLYARATDKDSNTSTGSTLQFTIVESDDDIVKPEVIFEDLTTIQKDGVKYVKVSPTFTTTDLTAKMDKDALRGETPIYTNLTSSNGLKTGSEIQINGETQYIVIVNGDVNCDGEVDFLNDIVMINNYRIGINKNLVDIQILAGDINNSGTIEFIPDIVAMNNYRLGRIKVL